MAKENYSMALALALDIADDCARIYKLLGNQSRYPYHEEQIVRALMTVRDNYLPEVITREELFMWKRKWTACNAQLQKYRKAAGHSTDDSATPAAVD